MLEFVKHNLDKFVMAALFVFMVSVVIHMSHDGLTDSGAVNWAREQAGIILGALVMLITGRRQNETQQKLDNLTTPPAKPDN